MPSTVIRRTLAAVAVTVATLGGAVAAEGGERPVVAACSISTALRFGSRGVAVECLQRRLSALGYAPGPIDGWFGAMTHDAVEAFQRRRGLFVDGVVGRQTATALGIWAAAESCAPPQRVPPRARRVVVVTANGSWATLDVLVRKGAEWTCKRRGLTARVGRNGVRPLAQRRSGDGTTPGGRFRLGTMTAPDGQTFQFFGNGPDPGVRGDWRQVEARDCWGATPYTAAYNRLVRRRRANCTGADEYLPDYVGSYSAAALIGANMGPHRSGDEPGEPPLAAAIFLHRHSYDATGATRGTAGCVSLSSKNLATVLRLLIPGRTWFIIR